MPELWERDAWELADEIRAGQLKARELLDTCLERIERHGQSLNAFCHLDPQRARAIAAETDRVVAEGDDPGLFAGVPFPVKELAAAEGMPWTEGSLLYADRVADHDDDSVARIRAAGANVVGKTTAPEFGSLNYTRTKIHGVTRNPWSPDRTPGGSSGGSAAAVAGGLVPIATGSDGGGSIRIPASFCGLFGFKGSQGRIPHGPGPFDGSLTSQGGAMTRSVRDAARTMDVMSGPNANDPTSLPKPQRRYEEVVTEADHTTLLRGRRAAWSATLGYAVCDPEVEQVAHESALHLCEEAGLELIDVDVHLPRPGATWGLVSAVEMVAFNREAAEGRYDDLTPFVRSGFEGPRPAARGGPGAGPAPATRDPHGLGQGALRGRLRADTHHGGDGFWRRGPTADGDRRARHGPDRRHPLHDASQPGRHTGLQHPGRIRRRVAGRPPGVRAPPRGRVVLRRRRAHGAGQSVAEGGPPLSFLASC